MKILHRFGFWSIISALIFGMPFFDAFAKEKKAGLVLDKKVRECLLAIDVVKCMQKLNRDSGGGGEGGGGGVEPSPPAKVGQ